MTTPPEIETLRSSRLTAEEIYWIAVNHPEDLFAPWDVAERAVLDAIDRTVEEASATLWHVARREAFREAVEALEDAGNRDKPPEWIDAAIWLTDNFLSPDNPEGNG